MMKRKTDSVVPSQHTSPRWSVLRAKQRGITAPHVPTSPDLSDAKPYACGFPHLYGSVNVVLSSNIIALQSSWDTNVIALPSSSENGFTQTNHNTFQSRCLRRSSLPRQLSLSALSRPKRPALPISPNLNPSPRNRVGHATDAGAPVIG